MTQKQKLLILCLGLVVILAGCKGTTPTPTSPEGTADHLVAAESWIPVPEEGLDPTDPDPDDPPVDGELVIFDPLTDGTTIGSVAGNGEFVLGEGYKVKTSWRGYIAYSTDIYKNIRLEFDAKGYVRRENDGSTGKMVVFEIFDSPHEYVWMGGGCWRSSYSMFHLRKRGLSKGQMHHKVDGLELKFGGRGRIDERKSWEGHSPSGHPFEWDPNTTYHWVVTIQNGEANITRNGRKMFSEVGSSEFGPVGPLNVRIGGSPYGRSGSQDVTYSNVKIYRLP